MKKYILTLLCMLTLAVSLVVVVPARTTHAVNVFGACTGNVSNTDVCKDKGSEGGSNPVITGLKVAITILAFIIGFTAVIMIIIGGITMITSGGDPQKVANARNTILHALIGVVIAAFAESIVAFILNKL